MFFKRRNKDLPAPANDAPKVEKTDNASAGRETRAPQAVSAAGSLSVEGLSVEGLSADALRRTVDADTLGFKTTADLDPADGPPGQDRALSALDFGLKMRAADFNVFVTGPRGAGKRTAVRAQLGKIAQSTGAPPDWVYVTNFQDPRRPRALKLPAGRARALERGVASALAELAATLPAAFKAEDYETRRRAIEEEFRVTHEDAVEDIHQKAAEQNIAVLRTPLGFGMAPMHDGKVVKPEVFNQLPEAMRRDVESRIGALQTELEAILANAPQADKERRRQLAALNEETARHAIESALDEISQAHADLPGVAGFLADAERDLVANVGLLLGEDAGGETAFATSEARPRAGSLFCRYAVHVVVAHEKDARAPLVSESDPTVSNLLGRLETSGPNARDGLSIRSGALHKANGGTLLLDAHEVCSSPEAWAALKRALTSREIQMDCGALQDAPDAIPLDVKVVLFGTPEFYEDLVARDPDVAELFKVRVDFNDATARTADSERRYARAIAAMVAKHDLKPIGSAGAARLIEEASRIASDREKLTLELARVADIVREADFWSRHAGRDVTTADDVKRAIIERTRRTDGARARAINGALARCDGGDSKPGQIVSLGTCETSGVVFGHPFRVTAHAHAGRGRIDDFVRAGALDGAAHTRGIAMLRDYLIRTFTRDDPLAVAATLVSEPSIGAQKKDGASLAELFAVLSALADLPLRSDLAVACALGPMGDVRAVDHINARIESFFDAATESELSDKPGVIIADANRRHLMLREDVVEAVRDGRFSIHAIKTVDEGLSLMTRREAGVRGADKAFAPDTVNGRIEAKLRSFAERAETSNTAQQPVSAVEKRA